MWSGFGNQQGLEVKCIQAAVRDDEDLRLFWQRDLRRGDQRAVECPAVIVGSLEELLLLRQSFPISLNDRINFRFRRQRKQTGILCGNRPQIGLLLAEPVEKNRADGRARDGLRIGRVRLE